MATTAMLHVRVDEQVKEQASEALASMLELPAEEARPGPLRRRGLSLLCSRRMFSWAGTQLTNATRNVIRDG